MASQVEELTIDYEEGGILLTKEIDKEVLSKGAWATLIFRYQKWDAAKEEYGKDNYMIRRYRKIRGEYVPQSKFNISSPKQANKMIEILSRWVEDADE